jgi:hypothetical protein
MLGSGSKTLRNVNGAVPDSWLTLYLSCVAMLVTGADQSSRWNQRACLVTCRPSAVAQTLVLVVLWMLQNAS